MLLMNKCAIFNNKRIHEWETIQHIIVDSGNLLFARLVLHSGFIRLN